MSSFYDVFVENAERYPTNIALEIQGSDRVESYTYAQARQMAEAVGQWLMEKGHAAGTRAVILADNHPRWVTTYLGIMAAGCVVVPLDTAFHADQVAKLLKDSGASLVFCDRKHRKLVEAGANGLPLGIVQMDGGADAGSAQVVADLDRVFAAAPGPFTPRPVTPDTLAGLLYTSGTTADPKGVMLTHGNLSGEAEAVSGWIDLGPEDAVLGVLPLFHVLSQMANILIPLVKGARVVHLETLNTTELLRALRERRITAFAVVPQFFYLIHERIFKEIGRRGKGAQALVRGLMGFTRMARRLGWNPGRLFFGKIHDTFGDLMRYLVTGGSRFEPQIGRDFYALGIDILQAYGLTETTAAAFATSPGDNVIGSVGHAMKGVEGKIVDPQPQEEGPPVGEIAIRGAVVMMGYWNRPDATEATLKEGWLHTGDLGYLDSRGNLFITGRKKELIVLANGKNIYPEEIEAHYLKSPYIKELAVMAMEARPGDPTSEHLHAVVVPNFEVLKQRKIVNSKEVIRFDIEGLSSQLASTKRIGSYEIWQEDLPRTTTRKLKRFEIEKKVRANPGKGASADAQLTAERPLTADEEAWLAIPEVQRGLPVLREAARTHPEKIRPRDNLELDLGLDSMQRVELLVALEKELGGDVEESRLAEIYTVRELVDVVRESAASGKSSPLARAQFAGWKAVLDEESTDPKVLALGKPQPFAEHFWFLVSRAAQMIASDRFDLKVSGLEKLPLKGPYILSSNHQSFIDPVVLGSLMPWEVFRRLFSVGTSEIFGSGFMRRLAGWLRVVVVDPDANLLPAMRAGAFGLRHGLVLMLYPEGERSIDGKPRIFKKGAAILSIHLQVPVVPVAIDGFHDAWPRGKKFQGFKPLKMKFGDAIHPPPESAASEDEYEKLTAEVKARIVEMWEEIRR
ncbi:MAG TPA: AMP-binding protein [Terriglobales bacterium]|nr:AMP-binding protein [Terriglobales bacterium]